MLCIKCFHFQRGLAIRNALNIRSYLNIRDYYLWNDKCTILRTISFSNPPNSLLHTTPGLYKRRKSSEERKIPKTFSLKPKPKVDVVEVWLGITVKELAHVLQRNVDYVQDLFLNEIRGGDTIIADTNLLKQAIGRSGKRIKIIGKPSEDSKLEDKDVYPRPRAEKSCMKPRPPVVTVMGHVDHGKTTLLDALRHTNVVKQEFGGITQHIGAFFVTLSNGSQVTFLDTPGHAAFTAMRERGANITDIVILVVAADDGVMEQTVESVRMARSANVPIIVAINKIDAVNADIERTERKLIEIGLQVEHMGGDVLAVPISALKQTNLDQLVETVATQAELMDIGADPTGLAEAVVIESKVDQHRGSVCTVIVQRGTLKRGSILVAGTVAGKVRLLRDADGNILNQVTPGYPAEIEGWKDLPQAGDIVLEVNSEQRARTVIRIREQKLFKEREQNITDEIMIKREQHLTEYKEQLVKKQRLGRFKLKREGPRKPEIVEDDSVPELNILIKSDVNGTLEAILDVIDTYNLTNCKLELVHYNVGAVTENDIELMEVFKGVIYAFNVDCPKHLAERAKAAGVPIKHHNVIYKLIDDIKSDLNAKLPQVEIEEVIGEAAVLQQFDINDGRKKVTVAGCRCVKGQLKRTLFYRLIRNEQIIFDGNLKSMKHHKEEVDTIKSGTECGLQLQDREIIFLPGDVLVCYEKRMKPQATTWDPGF